MQYGEVQTLTSTDDDYGTADCGDAELIRVSVPSDGAAMKIRGDFVGASGWRTIEPGYDSGIMPWRGGVQYVRASDDSTATLEVWRP